MKINPFIHSLAASVYIVLVVSLITTFSTLGEEKETVFIPMFMLSLLVLSVAVMGFLFFYQPLRLYVDGHKQEALTFFLKTIGFFACFVLVFLGVMLYTV